MRNRDAEFAVLIDEVIETRNDMDFASECILTEIYADLADGKRTLDDVLADDLQRAVLYSFAELCGKVRRRGARVRFRT
jgi:hypothetical protein